MTDSLSFYIYSTFLVKFAEYYLERGREELGHCLTPFSIGMWTGLINSGVSAERPVFPL